MARRRGTRRARQGSVGERRDSLVVLLRFRKEGEVRMVRRLTLEVWAMAGREWAPRISLAGGRCPRGSHEAPYLPTLVLEMMFRGGNVTVTP